MWGHLLRLYPAIVVAPFALLVPVFGLLAARLTLGERFDGLRLGGVARWCWAYWPPAFQ